MPRNLGVNVMNLSSASPDVMYEQALERFDTLGNGAINTCQLRRFRR